MTTKRRMVKYEDVVIKKLLSYPEKDSFLAPVQQQNHAIGRNVSVVEVLCHVNLLQHDRLVDRNAIVDRSGIGAVVQDQRGKPEWPACHVLPCNIKIFGTNLFDSPVGQRPTPNAKTVFQKLT